MQQDDFQVLNMQDCVTCTVLQFGRIEAHIAHCKKPSVKEEQDAKDSEEQTKRCEANANLCRAGPKFS